MATDWSACCSWQGGTTSGIFTSHSAHGVGTPLDRLCSHVLAYHSHNSERIPFIMFGGYNLQNWTTQPGIFSYFHGNNSYGATSIDYNGSQH